MLIHHQTAQAGQGRQRQLRQRRDAAPASGKRLEFLQRKGEGRCIGRLGHAHRVRTGCSAAGTGCSRSPHLQGWEVRDGQLGKLLAPSHTQLLHSGA